MTLLEKRRRKRAAAQIAVTIKMMIRNLLLIKSPILDPAPAMMMMMMNQTHRKVPMRVIPNLPILVAATPQEAVAPHQRMILAVVQTQTLPIALTATRRAALRATAPL